MNNISAVLSFSIAFILCCRAYATATGKAPRYCSLAPDPGPCLAHFTSYFYNSTSERCERFVYGGCRGNKNSFTDFLSCMKACHVCDIEGAEYSSCDSPCRRTCERPNVNLYCRAPCRFGCTCPSNLVLDTVNQRCVRVKECPSHGKQCDYNGQKYNPGDTFNSTDGCNTCTCSRNGQVVCTRRACRPKMMCPGLFPPGTKGVCAELCSSDDDCALDEKCCSNGCGHQCKKGVLCAAVLCQAQNCSSRDYISPGPDKCCGACGCRYGGKLYRPGQRFPAADGCNTCVCSQGGTVSCTEKACPPKDCSIRGQRYFDASKGQCVPCTGTCAKPNAVCTRECRSGCACPVGTVLDEENNRCTYRLFCPTKCKYGGKTYNFGDRWDCSTPGQCMRCWCISFGYVFKYRYNCLRPCILKNGTSIPHGTSFKTTPCTHCSCSNGRISCAIQDCARPPCENPVVPEGKCCPVCPSKGCTLTNGTVVPEGSFQLDPCTGCTCKDGRLRCFVQDCAAPPCQNYYVPPGECCPVCPRGCRYNGQIYRPGSTFNSTDGCNTCTCFEDNIVACTERACRPKMMCPSASPPGSRVGVCAELCSSDDDCALDEKCCSNGCGHQCTKGVLCAAVTCPANPTCPFPTGVVVPAGPDECCTSCGCDIGGGKVVRIGDSYKQDCNGCSCTNRGPICTLIACRPGPSGN